MSLSFKNAGEKNNAVGRCQFIPRILTALFLKGT
jgi:hypothetical protein